MHSFHSTLPYVSQSHFSSNDWTLGLQGGTTPDAIQANFQKWLSGPQTTGLIILEHELTNASVQCFMAAYPLMKQYNWNLKSVTTLDSDGPWFNSDDDTSNPTVVPLTAGGNGGAGLIAASSTSSTSTTPTPTSSSSSSKPSSNPDSNAKKNGAVPGLNSSPIMMLMSTLALVSGLYLI
jgi:chitin deacetylase